MAYTVIPALGRLRQEGGEFESSLGYITGLCLKTKQKNRTRKIDRFLLAENRSKTRIIQQHHTFGKHGKRL